MTTTNSIILPIDFSTPSLGALPWARRISATLGAAIHCIYVVEEPQVYSMLDMPVPVQIPTAQEIAEIAAERLGTFADEHLQGLAAAGVTKVLIGKPAKEIVAYADEVEAQMIVMATHGHSGIEHILLGSTTEAVLRHAKCPVLSIPKP
jgi:nucleotide-binding universal stress UspA family protein